MNFARLILQTLVCLLAGSLLGCGNGGPKQLAQEQAIEDTSADAPETKDAPKSEIVAQVSPATEVPAAAPPEREFAYKYFRSPHQFANYKETPDKCSFCSQVKPGYKCSLYGLKAAGPYFICDSCFSSGKIKKEGFFSNTGSGDLVEQIRKKDPSVSRKKAKELARKRGDELLYRTPKPLTNQDLEWPSHCGDYCCYVKEVGKEDLNRLAADGDGAAFLVSHLAKDQKSASDQRTLWNKLREDSPKDVSKAYSPGVYLFECLACKKTILRFDYW